jgi:hypothetical protein
MNSEQATIHPRSRRNPAYRAEKTTVAPVEDPRTRVLIRVPWIPARSEAKAKPAAEVAASVSSTQAALPPSSLGSTDTPPRLPQVAAPIREPRSFVRFDSSHSALPAPHTAAPAWLEPSSGWLTKLSRQPTVWLTALVVTAVLIVFILRTGNNNSTSTNSAPSANSAKREVRKPTDQPPTDSAAETKPARADVARRSLRAGSGKSKKRANQPVDDGPVFVAPSPAAASNSSTPTSEQTGLNRRAGMNTPGSLNDSRDWQPNPPPVDLRGNSESFQPIDGPSTALPAINAAPPADSSNGPRDGNPRAAWFTDSIDPPNYRRQ